MEIKIKEFDPSKIEKDKVCVIIGKSGSGKSTLITDLLWHVRSIPKMICMSGTEEGKNYYRNIIPDSNIYGEFKPDVLEAGINRQNSLMRKGINSELGFLFDDLMYDNSMIKHPLIKKIFMHRRHWKVFTMLTMQYSMDMPPELRANVDYLFIFREITPANQKKLYDQFFGIFPNKDAFVDILMKCTEDYSCIVLDNTSKSNNIEDVVFFYKAEYPLKEYRIGN
jgi:ABC-type dipeptide/oligopeptide/nickel transport system ATPase component